MKTFSPRFNDKARSPCQFGNLQLVFFNLLVTTAFTGRWYNDKRNTNLTGTFLYVGVNLKVDDLVPF